MTAVTERAGVTRRTFYSHFRDIPDLVNQIEEETLAELRAPLARLASCTWTTCAPRSTMAGPPPAPPSCSAASATAATTCGRSWARGETRPSPSASRRSPTRVVGPARPRRPHLRALGPLFDYYLTFAISAEVGVLLRWLDGGMREGVGVMARLMTALMFVRPGDLYDNPIDLDLPSFALAAMCSEEDN